MEFERINGIKVVRRCPTSNVNPEYYPNPED